MPLQTYVGTQGMWETCAAAKTSYVGLRNTRQSCVTAFELMRRTINVTALSGDAAAQGTAQEPCYCVHP
jgi:hypothetical protein